MRLGKLPEIAFGVGVGVAVVEVACSKLLFDPYVNTLIVNVQAEVISKK